MTNDSRTATDDWARRLGVTDDPRVVTLRIIADKLDRAAGGDEQIAGYELSWLTREQRSIMAQIEAARGVTASVPLAARYEADAFQWEPTESKDPQQPEE